jgi:hypothetical protein
VNAETELHMSSKQDRPGLDANKRANEFDKVVPQVLKGGIGEAPAILRSRYEPELEFALFQTGLKDALTSTTHATILDEPDERELIHRLIDNGAVLERLGLFALPVARRNRPSATVTDCLLQFVDACRGFFDDIDAPLRTREATTEANVRSHLQLMAEHLAALPTERLPMRPLIVVDDLGFEDDEWFEALEALLPFVESDRTSVLFMTCE